MLVEDAEKQRKYSDNLGSDGDWRPRPDPSILTTQQLNQAVIGLKEIIGVRLDAIEKANTTFVENINRVPTDVQKAVATLESLHESKFRQVLENIKALNILIDEKFLLRDKGVNETAALNSTALQAALAAAKESAQKQTDWFGASALKTESGFTKQIESLGITVQALGNSLGDKLNDLKERQNLIEGRSGGMNSLWGWIVAAAGLVFSGITILIAIAVYFSHNAAVIAR